MRKRTKGQFHILDESDAEEFLSEYFDSVVDFRFAVTRKNTHIAYFIDKKHFIFKRGRKNEWLADFYICGFHGFFDINLNKQDVVIPLCFATLSGRVVANIIAKSTIISGKPFQKDLEILLISKDDILDMDKARGIFVSMDSSPLAHILPIAEVAPPGSLRAYEDDLCPFCTSKEIYLKFR